MKKYLGIIIAIPLFFISNFALATTYTTTWGGQYYTPSIPFPSATTLYMQCVSPTWSGTPSTIAKIVTGDGSYTFLYNVTALSSSYYSVLFSSAQSAQFGISDSAIDSIAYCGSTLYWTDVNPFTPTSTASTTLMDWPQGDFFMIFLAFLAGLGTVLGLRYSYKM